MSPIDIIQVKHEIQAGKLAVEYRDGNVLLTDKQSGEAVCIASLTPTKRHPAISRTVMAVPTSATTETMSPSINARSVPLCYSDKQRHITPQNEPLTSGFDVVDTKTGEYPDLCEIALTEDWTKDLMYCDMEGFAVEEDGTLILMDECGRYAFCPEGRFEIRRPPERQEEQK